MAETKAKVEAVGVTDPGDELVTVQLMRDNGRYKDDVFVCVNGVGCTIKRGVPVQIKRKYAEVLERSLAQDARTAELISSESGAALAK